ncbi:MULTISPECIES: hypothetical protein [Paenibacillus]|uniref:hypothetical protein n=1 Tax=Paenibacillus TaxID=44249 RepID=UPI00096C4740|nr:MULTISPECIES: hypothetical protein [Paenibacillus]OMD26824.1 hypothetical protein BJP48_21895 [Paenibacillus odorifer]OME15294.1 hypothetical protein BSK60_11380 [Paenibacillus odorifer]OMF89803.1 hypothetical protein BK147_24825 [Paenibacillus sp. FSL R7-0337]
MQQESKPFSETDVITVPELATRLKVSKFQAYEMVSIHGCPVYELGGERQKRIIWGDFLDWFRSHYVRQ